MNLSDVAVTTSIAVGVSSLISMTWRLIDRSDADWVPERSSSLTFREMGGQGAAAVRTLLRFLQAGDGTAFQVSIEAHGEGVSAVFNKPHRLSMIALAKPGDSVVVEIVCPYDRVVWEQSSITLRWVRPPTWRKNLLWGWGRHGSQSWKIADIARPGMTFSDAADTRTTPEGDQAP
ncbi:hypothetical protein [Actinomyces urogenitalis]|uniref:hypothetical protein n=1 Tax=Actinomyces urogenitalis TaxID=103621 RepID=UPI00058C1E5B|nr:hypothetical protein [Actinomyces urogenitalis]